jgi:hypothetical protein
MSPFGLIIGEAQRDLRRSAASCRGAPAEQLLEQVDQSAVPQQREDCAVFDQTGQKLLAT